MHIKESAIEQELIAKLGELKYTSRLSQAEIAQLFETSKHNISLHLKNLVEDRELEAAATVKESLTVHTGENRDVQR